MIVPCVRSRFGRREAALLVHLLERQGEDPAAWERIVAERGIDPLLDHPAVPRAILAESGVSRLPLPVVAYVLLRHGLLEAGVESRPLADYLSSLFIQFGIMKRPYRIAEYDDREYHYLVDILNELSESRGRRAFLLRVHLGNLALWLSGFFPDWIETRVSRKGGPGLEYYEEMGQAGFALAADDPFARRESLDGLFREAAGSFTPMRRALNEFSDRFLTPAPASPVDRMLRQARDSFQSRWLQA